ncbi:MAG: hypothetical protein ISR98_01730 [Parcubacteria group bacterium]|nr:hypothetical protein [Parcubacteria group bacterium]
MDKVSKFLKRLSKQERLKLRTVIKSVLDGKIKDLDVKKLSGYQNIFRVRVGDMRVVFENNDGSMNLIFVGRKSDKTYKF